jgi:hypothetical protein
MRNEINSGNGRIEDPSQKKEEEREIRRYCSMKKGRPASVKWKGLEGARKRAIYAAA